jgi:hypothetical protein
MPAFLNFLSFFGVPPALSLPPPLCHVTLAGSEIFIFGIFGSDTAGGREAKKKKDWRDA